MDALENGISHEIDNSLVRDAVVPVGVGRDRYEASQRQDISKCNNRAWPIGALEHDTAIPLIVVDDLGVKKHFEKKNANRQKGYI